MNIEYIHPMIVHFPIALLIMAFVADIASYIFKNLKHLESTGYYLMISGTIGVFAAFISGFFFTEHPVEGLIYEVFEKHQIWGIITTSVFIIASVLRVSMKYEKEKDKFTKVIFYVLYSFGIIGLIYTSHHGSILVFEFMIK